jgi:hypothetical protein
MGDFGNGGDINQLLEIKFTLEQATKDQRGSRGTALLFL